MFNGLKSLVLPNTKIGNKVIIGAGSIVAKNIPDNSVVCGNPIKIICTFDEYVEKMRNKMKENLVKENSVEKEIIFCGNQVNPYPFIKQADIYVQPSYFGEGYPTTICEAIILNKVIIGTTTSWGLREQIEHRKSGLIVEPKVITISAGIENVIVDKILKENLEKSVKTIDFSHKDEINKILSLI